MSNKDSITLVVLKTGQNLIGFVSPVMETEFAAGAITLTNPCELIQQQTTVGFAPYLLFSSETSCIFDLTLDVRHILTPVAELRDAFYQQFGSGLITPDSKIALQ